MQFLPVPAGFHGGHEMFSVAMSSSAQIGADDFSYTTRPRRCSGKIQHASVARNASATAILRFAESSGARTTGRQRWRRFARPSSRSGQARQPFASHGVSLYAIAEEPIWCFRRAPTSLRWAKGGYRCQLRRALGDLRQNVQRPGVGFTRIGRPETATLLKPIFCVISQSSF